MIIPLIKSTRPSQWTKNFLLFAGLIFSLNVFVLDYFLLSFSAFIIFCMLAGSSYIVNDLFDLENDRKHHKKLNRPLASGEISKISAGIFALILSSIGILWSFFILPDFGYICLLYFILSISYSAKLKNYIIIDVLIIATGFVIRTIAGTVVINVEISKWLLVCAIFFSLFLALSKRLSELNSNSEKEIRKTLSEYSPILLIQLISISASSAVISYTLYTVDNITIEKFGTINLIYTVPFVIYGIFRYMYLVHNKNLGEYPELIFLKDRATLINVVLYVITVIYILY